jgi:hypothetical protein
VLQDLVEVQSHLGYDLREDEWPEAFMFCPECADQEFGGQRLSSP